MPQYRYRQRSNVEYVEGIDGVQRLIDRYIKLQSDQHGDYYFHIDSLHVFPPVQNTRYPVLLLFHRVYLDE